MVNTFVPTDSQEAQCPECGAVIRIAGRRRRVQCPKCREIVTLSTPEPEKRLPKPPPPVAAMPSAAAAANAGGEPGRLEAIESRIEASENAKLKAQGSSIEAIEGSKLEAQGSKLEALESRLAALEEGMKAVSADPAPSEPEKSTPITRPAPALTRAKEPPAHPEPEGTETEFGKTVRIASPDELENPIPGLPPLTRVAKASGIPPPRFRWLAPDESHAPGISPAQADVLLHNLRTIPAQEITIRTMEGNPFARQCAEAFRHIFDRAGWTVHGVEEIPRTIAEPGLSLAVASLPVEKEAAATYLSLKAAGFSPVPVLDTTLASGARENATLLCLTFGPSKTT